MRIAIIGTGLMGRAVGERLLELDHELSVWNRTPSKAQPLAEAGARLAESPAQAVQGSEVVITLLKDAPAIEEVVMSQPCLDRLEGRTVVQMGTISPQESRAFEPRIRGVGGTYLDAPVLGSTPQAKQGELWIMVSGERSDFENWLPLLRDLGPEPLFLGPVGRSATLKLALNQLLVSLVASFSVSLGMVLRGDVPLDDFLTVVRESDLHSPQFDKKLPRMLSRDFSDPHFPVSHMLKDVDLALEVAQGLGLGADTLLGVRAIVERALDMGFVGVDYSAIYNAVNPEG